VTGHFACGSQARYGTGMGSRETPRKGVRRDLTITAAITCLSLAAVWWSTRPSLAALSASRGTSGEMWACPAILPAPPSCYPAWHLQVVAVLTVVVVAVLAGAVLVIRRRGGATGSTFAFVVLIGLCAWFVGAFPTRFLPIW